VSIANYSKQAEEDRQNAEATATTHSITVSDLAMMHTAIDSKLSRWRELAKTAPTHVNAEAAGFSKSSNTAEVVYGYCDDTKQHFYLYVLNEKPPKSNFFADTEAMPISMIGIPTPVILPNGKLRIMCESRKNPDVFRDHEHGQAQSIFNSVSFSGNADSISNAA